jgi:hypothetical protein
MEGGGLFGNYAAEAGEQLVLVPLVGTEFANFLIQERVALGLPPIKPTSSSTIVTLAILGIFLSLFLALIYQGVMGTIRFFGKGISGGLKSKTDVVLFCFIIGCILSFLIYNIFIVDYLKWKNVDVAKTYADSLKTVFEGFKTGEPPADTTLSNIQALAVKQVAYIGPNEDRGIFDIETGVQSSLRTGIRFFVFQIDYLDSTKSGFDDPLTPTLVYRKESGKLMSINGANIKDVAKMLATYAFSPEVASSDKPLVIYLHFQRTPNLLRNPAGYIKFLSKTAESLEPLFPFILGSSSEGNFQRQQSEKMLLNMDLTKLQKKVIYISNADTSPFRNTDAYSTEKYEKKYDLDYLVNLRVYLENESDTFGVTQPSSQFSSAVIVPFNRLKAMNDTEQDKFATKYRGKFVIAMPPQGGNPSKDDMKAVLNNTGVNCIPLNLFGEPIETLNSKMGLWHGEPLYKLKGVNYRAVEANS